MAAPLEVTVYSTNQKLGYTGALRSLPPVAIDYIPPFGDGQGYLPLEMLLMSLAACSDGTIGLLLRKKGKNVTGITVTATGTRREAHPASFSKINLSFAVTSNEVDDGEVQRALTLAEESVCPVWAMIKGNAEITGEYRIIAEQAETGRTAGKGRIV